MKNGIEYFCCWEYKIEMFFFKDYIDYMKDIIYLMYIMFIILFFYILL